MAARHADLVPDRLAVPDKAPIGPGSRRGGPTAGEPLSGLDR